MGCTECCSILLAIIFPPCGVFCATGCSCDLIINILLTTLAWIPGVLHAFYVLGTTSADKHHTRHLAPPARREARPAQGSYQPLPGHSPGPAHTHASAGPVTGYPVGGGEPSTLPERPPPSGYQVPNMQ
mmetsp:Transcript_3919/g.11391  ORF Transcript_3919/g.11391 Transcript_3919/m.11391 type:complete len:129 (-) Transcript_3919:799-1185(-)